MLSIQLNSTSVWKIHIGYINGFVRMEGGTVGIISAVSESQSYLQWR